MNTNIASNIAANEKVEKQVSSINAYMWNPEKWYR